MVSATRTIRQGSVVKGTRLHQAQQRGPHSPGGGGSVKPTVPLALAGGEKWGAAVRSLWVGQRRRSKKTDGEV